jgi:hypothetical protein
MSERGALLFRVSEYNQRSRYLWLLAAVTFAAVFLMEARWRHRDPNWALLVLAAFYTVMFFVQGRAEVYKSGIHLPSDSSGARGRFIAWSQAERFHWDEDVLTIVPTSSVMAGADLGRPLVAGSLRLPKDKRAQIENLLGGSRGPSAD